MPGPDQHIDLFKPYQKSILTFTIPFRVWILSHLKSGLKALFLFNVGGIRSAGFREQIHNQYFLLFSLVQRHWNTFPYQRWRIVNADSARPASGQLFGKAAWLIHKAAFGITMNDVRSFADVANLIHFSLGSHYQLISSEAVWNSCEMLVNTMFCDSFQLFFPSGFQNAPAGFIFREPTRSDTMAVKYECEKAAVIFKPDAIPDLQFYLKHIITPTPADTCKLPYARFEQNSSHYQSFSL